MSSRNNVSSLVLRCLRLVTEASHSHIASLVTPSPHLVTVRIMKGHGHG